MKNGLHWIALEFLPLSKAFFCVCSGWLDGSFLNKIRIRCVFDGCLVPIELAGYVLMLGEHMENRERNGGRTSSEPS